MKQLWTDLRSGIGALPSFPVVLVTVARNIMTAAAFHFYSFEPPLVMVGIMPARATYDLINREGEFGINLPTAEQIALVRACGAISARDVPDKYAHCGVTPLPGVAIKSALIAECPVNIECRVVHRIAYGGTHQWYIGEIVAVRIDEGYARDQPLMFWAGEYRRVGEFLERAW